MDEFDHKLVALLKQDGRMSFTDIAQQLEVAVSTVRNRYNRLVDENILHILGWVDPTKANYHSYSRVTIEVRPSHLLESAVQALAQIEEVSFLAITSGDADVEINLTCRDNEHLLQVMQNKIHPIEGVFKTTSTIYLEVKKWASHPLNEAISLTMNK